MDGPNVNWDVLKLRSSYREWNEFSKLINIDSCGLCYTVPCKQDWWKQIGKSIKFYMQCGKYLINHLQREILLSGKLVVIFFLCIFARPNGLRMNPLLHDELRHGRILFRLWSTGFHCQKVNVRVIRNRLIPWSGNMQINWWSPNSVFLNISHQFLGRFYFDVKPVSQWFPSLLFSLM